MSPHEPDTPAAPPEVEVAPAAVDACPLAPPAASGLSGPPRRWIAREYFESLVVAVILALFIRTFVVQAFKIPTSSMEHNLLVGDHLLVNKVVYAPSAGWLEAALVGQRRVARGHVVVFKFPEEPTRDFIKRVIGLPGDVVEIRDKRVRVNGVALDEPYVHFREPPRGDFLGGLRGELVRDNWGPQRVPAGHLFVMGDNRDNSRDSRYWGFLPIDQVRGRALLVYWSSAPAEESGPRRADGARDTLSALHRTRWERVFHLIR